MVRFFIEARTWDSECPAAVLAQTNAILRSRLRRRVALVTAFLGDRRRRRAALRERRPRPAARGRARAAAVRELPATGLPLGIEDDAEFEARELPFEPATCCSPAPTGSSRRAARASCFGARARAGPRRRARGAADPAGARRAASTRARSPGRRSSATTSRSSRCGRGDRASSCATSRRAARRRRRCSTGTWRSCTSASRPGVRAGRARSSRPRTPSTRARELRRRSTRTGGRSAAAALCSLGAGRRRDQAPVRRPPSARGRGHGRRLLRELERRAAAQRRCAACGW